MGTEILRQAVAQALPQGTSVHEASDVISGIISPTAEKPRETPAQEPEQARPAPVRQQAQEPIETPDEPLQDDPGAQDAPDTDVEDTAPIEASEQSESAGTPDDATEIELEPSQLAALLGLKEEDLVVDDDGALSFKAKLDGGSVSVPLSDLRESYQLTKRADQRLTKLGDDRKAFEAERDTKFQHLQQQSEQMAQAITTIEREYAAEWENVDWQKLRAEDPGEFAVRRADFEDRARRLNGYKAQHQQQVQQGQEAWQQEQQKSFQEGHQKLNDAMAGPEFAKAGEWNEDAKNEVYQSMVASGVPEQILQSTPYWQAFVWARKAMLYDKMTTEAKKTAKKVARLPKITKPGAKKSKTQAKRGNLAEARIKQRKGGGNIQSTAERISAIMRGS